MSKAAPAPSARSTAGVPGDVEGITPPANPAGTGGFLSDVIVELGFVDREIVEQAVEAARQPGRMVDRILLENGDLTEEQLSRALAERYGLDHVDLDLFEVDMSAASLISRTTALRYRAIPIAFATDGALIVAVADPVDALAISDLEVMTRTETRRAVASGAAIDALAERLPEVGTPQPSSIPSEGEERSEPRIPEESAPAATVEAEIDTLESATEQSALLAEPGEGVPQHLEPLSQADPAPDPGDDRARVEFEARIAALEAELAKTRDLMREQAEQTEQAEAELNRLQEEAVEVAGERDRLREALDHLTHERDQLSEALDQVTPERDRLREALDQVTPERDQLSEALDQVTPERDRLREALDQVTHERDDLNAETQRLAGEFTSVQERATQAESVADEANARIRELEDADRRAETARLALKELREESEREREQSSRLERKLREDLAAAQERGTTLEKRLDGLTAVASQAQATAEELMSVSRAISGDDPSDDLPDTSDDPPEPPAAESQPPETNNGAADDVDRLGPGVRKPTI